MAVNLSLESIVERIQLLHRELVCRHMGIQRVDDMTAATTHALARVLRALLSRPERVALVPVMWNADEQPTAWRLDITGEGPILDKRHRGAVEEAMLGALSAEESPLATRLTQGGV